MRQILAVAADRGGDRAPWCGLQLLAWVLFAPIAAGAAVALALCLGPAA